LRGDLLDRHVPGRSVRAGRASASCRDWQERQERAHHERRAAGATPAHVADSPHRPTLAHVGPAANTGDETDVDRLLARVSGPKQAVLVDGSGHGWDLLQGAAAAASLQHALDEFLTRAGSPVATGCG